MFMKCRDCEGRVVIEWDVVRVFSDPDEEIEYDEGRSAYMVRAICFNCQLSSNWIEQQDPTIVSHAIDISELTRKCSDKKG